VAHATGTRTNSRTDLACVAEARETVRRLQGSASPLPPMTISAPKALGDGHSMGETGLKAVGEAIQYVLGKPAVGIPTLRRLDDELAGLTSGFRFSAAPVPEARWSARRVSAGMTPPSLYARQTQRLSSATRSIRACSTPTSNAGKISVASASSAKRATGGRAGSCAGSPKSTAGPHSAPESPACRDEATPAARSRKLTSRRRWRAGGGARSTLRSLRTARAR
jgi:hypothetical protein